MSRSLAAGVVGGTVAAATGGNFENGMMTSAFGEMFNACFHEQWQQISTACNADPGGCAATFGIAVAGGAAGFTAASSFLTIDAASSAGDLYGPLVEGPLSADIANTFRSGSYVGRVLDQATIFWRVTADNDNALGNFWTAVQLKGPLQSVIDLALDQNWGNTAVQTYSRVFPAGTQVYEGAAAGQRGLVDGGSQIYIP
ncbi:MAG: hypothetical protein K0R98_1614 [Rickettsiaceae bacterium]|jgi:hypothetical protein|nr:hypothetical protein [Gammaproteobacteria bacterium]MCE3233357.1 hypothetical protein [Rickettsiaceae bacterium]